MSRPVLLLCLVGCANTVSLGAFPAVVADIASTRGLSDVQLGVLASAFGLARVLADLPVGALATRRLRMALVVAPLMLAGGVGCLVAGGSFATLVLGRGLIGVGHAFAMVGGLTAILRFSDPRRITSALSAFELGGMLGVLTGMLLIGVLPAGLAWNHAFLIASCPQAVGLALLPFVLRALPQDAGPPSDPAVAGSAVTRSPAEPAPPARAARGGAVATGLAGSSPSRVWLAYPTAALMALAWSASTQFVVPLRGMREFALTRPQIAGLLIVPQVADIACLIPVGIVADRLRPAPVLGAVALVLAAGVTLVWFTPLALAVVGCALLGIALAGWMLPLAIIRQASSDRVARRTAIYRVAVDTGIFLGPFASGLLGESRVGILGILIASGLATFALLFLRPPRPGRPMPAPIASS